MNPFLESGKIYYRKYFLVKYLDVADKIVLEGFRIFSGVEFQRWYINLLQFFPCKLWAGGFLYKEYKTFDEYLRQLHIENISERKYNYLLRQFGKKYGDFLQP